MSTRTRARPPDILADPFEERTPASRNLRIRLLGGDFDFQTANPELHRIVLWAYANLPRHRLPAATPRFSVKLSLAQWQRGGDVPRIATLSGCGLLGAASGASDFAMLSPHERAGLIVVSRDLLRARYHVRYELLEFAVLTLAQRAQRLVPLHAACVGRAGRGVLLMGASGAGKSTAALQWLAHSLEFLAEDSVLVEPGSMLATAVPNFLHVRRDALRFVPEALAGLVRRSPVIRRRSGVEKFEVDLRRPEFRLARRPLQIAGIAFMTAETAGHRELLVPLRRAEVLARLHACQPYAAAQPGWTTFTRSVTRISAYELRRANHPAQALEALGHVLDTPARTS
jgi:hypothetical protein